LDKLGTNTSQRKQIENLLDKLGEDKAGKILSELHESIECFRRRPIRRMRDGSLDRPDGDLCEGEGLMRQLENESSLDRVVALGKILYLIRPNLFHGSKAQTGDDREIVERSIAPLRVLLAKSISLTEQKRNELRCTAEF